MTTAELTLKLNAMSNRELMGVQKMLDKIFAERKAAKVERKIQRDIDRAGRMMPKYTKKELLARFEAAEEDYKAGRVCTWEDIQEECTRRYGS